MTPHIASRWYRAPEIILTEQHYDLKVDMWSMGCVLGELVNYTDQYQVNGVTAKDRVLFPGTSCFPLSPFVDPQEGQDHCNVSSNDQMIKIIEVIGK